MFSALAALIFYTAPLTIQEGIASAAPSIEVPVVESSDHQHLKNYDSRSTKAANEIAAILRNGKTYEKCGDLSSALQCYKSGYKQFPGSNSIQQHLSRMKVLCDIQKRYASKDHQLIIRKMDPEEFRLFVASFFEIFCSNYCSELTPSEIFQREIVCIDIALNSRDFRSEIIPEHSTEQIREFRRAIRNKKVQTYDELIAANLELGELFEKHFHENGAILVVEGMFSFIASLDTYSEVLLPIQHKDQLAGIHGNVVGIGTELSTVAGKTRIERLVPKSPAALAGIQRLDTITHINDIPISGKQKVQISEMLCGTEGSPVQLTLERKNGETYTVKLLRRHVTYPSVSCVQLISDTSKGSRIGYIHLEKFQTNTPDEMEDHLKMFLQKGVTGLVIDLRGNPGGTVTSAVNAANLFLDKGVILKTRSRSKISQQYTADPIKYYGLPLVILVDHESASAAEIFAAAIKDHKRGILIGKQTFGKWVIQSLLPIPNSQFHMKLTTYRFYSPNEHQYNHVGIEPDYEIHQTGKPIFKENLDFQENFSVGHSHASQLLIQDPILMRAASLLSEAAHP